MNIRFYIRSSSKDSKKLANIRVRLNAGRGMDMHSKTMITVHPDQWSNETQNYRQRSDIKNLDKKKQQLRDLRSFIEDEYNLATGKGSLNSKWLSEVVDRYHNPDGRKSDKPSNLLQFIADFTEKAKTRTNPKTGRPVSYKQQREYERTAHYFREFCKAKNREYDFKDIDLDFYDDWKAFLEDQGRTSKDGKKVTLAVNTVGKKLQTFKVFLNDAAIRGHEVNPVYKSGRFIAVKEESDSIYLEVDELKKLFLINLSGTPWLEKVRDLFLVGCWTGLRFGDLHQVKQENISGNNLVIKQSKTEAKVVIPVHPIVKSILEKYGNKLPRVISNQKFNEALKEIGKMAEINSIVHKGITRAGTKVSLKYKKWELLSTHTARRSFATNLYKSGFPAYSIMQITGHQTEKAFLKYIKVTPDEHAKLLQLHWEKMGGHLMVV